MLAPRYGFATSPNTGSDGVTVQRTAATFLIDMQGDRELWVAVPWFLRVTPSSRAICIHAVQKRMQA
jgi:hypothetical protein